MPSKQKLKWGISELFTDSFVRKIEYREFQNRYMWLIPKDAENLLPVLLKKQKSNYTKSKKYDLLILDVTLSDGTGFEVCENVRKHNKQTLIIFLTASDEEVNIIRGLDCGGDDYVTKPFKLGGTMFPYSCLVTTCRSNTAGQGECIEMRGHFD